MKTKRSVRYLSTRKSQRTTPLQSKKDIQQNSDARIDQDFPGYPNGSSSDEMIKPKSATQKKTAGIQVKDGEKVIKEDTAKNKAIK